MRMERGASKVWFVTGASSGFGRAIADEALARGDRVVVTARKVDSLDDFVARYPEQAYAVQLDVSKGDHVRAAVASALARFGAVDVLVNNAGHSVIGAVEETSEEELRAAMEVMFFGPVALTRALLPHMRERRTGTVVQISGMGGITTWAGFGAAVASKHALEGLSECMADEITPLGIRVLIVEPGAFRTQLFGAAFRRLPPLAAYEPTVGPTRGYATQLDGTQTGDPAKAARAIADAVEAGVPTLRLPLGDDAVTRIREKLAEIGRDVDRTEAIARAMRLGG